jgi:OmpA family protein
MNRFSIDSVHAVIVTLSLGLVACSHAPVPSVTTPPVTQPSQPINMHGGMERYGEREIWFEFNQTALNAGALGKLDEGAEILKKHPDLIVEVSGHADLRENRIRPLSLQRGGAAYDYLLSKGVNAFQMLGPVGYGASRPVYEHENDPQHPANRANRRVEVSVLNQAYLAEMVTIENILRGPLEGPRGADKIIAGLHQVYEMAPVRDCYRAQGPAVLADKYVLSFASVRMHTGAIHIGLQDEPCYQTEQAAALIGAVADPTVNDAHGVDRGKTFSANRNGVMVYFDTTPDTYRCVISIHIRTAHKEVP